MACLFQNVTFMYEKIILQVSCPVGIECKPAAQGHGSCNNLDASQLHGVMVYTGLRVHFVFINPHSNPCLVITIIIW